MKMNSSSDEDAVVALLTLVFVAILSIIKWPLVTFLVVMTLRRMGVDI